jgi:hypothetical protein
MRKQRTFAEDLLANRKPAAIRPLQVGDTAHQYIHCLMLPNGIRRPRGDLSANMISSNHQLPLSNPNPIPVSFPLCAPGPRSQ